mmetsp:Transcript_134302/g.237612  ORF Transcript_134302/g.237612 Transcript_134302/m.237612 type:complete len:86 (+) Transcript_134302:518-775(+)
MKASSLPGKQLLHGNLCAKFMNELHYNIRKFLNKTLRVRSSIPSGLLVQLRLLILEASLSAYLLQMNPTMISFESWDMQGVRGSL